MKNKKRPKGHVYRKIWEDYNNKKIPKGYHIHHIDGDPFNNDATNLICVSPKEHYEIHLKNNDIVALKGKFIQKASEAGKIGGKTITEKRIKASKENMLKNRCPTCGGKASAKSNKKNKRYFFNENWQKENKKRCQELKLGNYSEKHIKHISDLGKSKRIALKSPDGKLWEKAEDASKFYGISPVTIRWRCRNNKKGWLYLNDEQKPII